MLFIHLLAVLLAVQDCGRINTMNDTNSANNGAGGYEPFLWDGAEVTQKSGVSLMGILEIFVVQADSLDILAISGRIYSSSW